LDATVPLAEHSCFNYRHACQFLPVCWRGETIEERLANGKLVGRKANHPQEMGETEADGDYE
jgi:hypothetical protein